MQIHIVHGLLARSLDVIESHSAYEMQFNCSSYSGGLNGLKMVDRGLSPQSLQLFVGVIFSYYDGVVIMKFTATSSFLL